MKFLAVIPARGGSKGIPKKNLCKVGGLSLVEHAFIAAKSCISATDIIVSSEDADILAVAKGLGHQHNYKRPRHLAEDDSRVIDVILDILKWFADRSVAYDAIILLQPTSPLRTGEDIRSAISKFMVEGRDSLVSVNKMFEHPYECVSGQSGDWSFLVDVEEKLTFGGRQGYEKDFYFINGAIYISKIEFLRKNRRFFKRGEATLFEMSKSHSVDIDEQFDLDLARSIYNLEYTNFSKV